MNVSTKCHPSAMVLDSLHCIADRSEDTNNSVSKPRVDAYVDAVVSSAINVTQDMTGMGTARFVLCASSFVGNISCEVSWQKSNLNHRANNMWTINFL